MSLIWHIVKKDLRRLAVPTALWIALAVAVTLGLRHAPLSVERMGTGSEVAEVTAALAQWRSVVGWGCGVLLGFQTAVVVLLAAFFVQQDPMVGTTAFWQTRPISRARWLAAKSLGAILLFAVFPTLAQAAVWFGSGFSPIEVGLAGSEFMLWQFIAAVAGLAFGVMTANLGTFLFAAIGWLGAFPLVAAFNHYGPDIRGRNLALAGLFCGGPLLMFLARSRWRTRWAPWLIYVGFLILAVCTRFGAPEFVSWVAAEIHARARPGGPLTEADRALSVRVGTVSEVDGEHVVDISVRAGPGAKCLPVVVWAGMRYGEVRGDWLPAHRWGAPAARLVLGGGDKSGELPWELRPAWTTDGVKDGQMADAVNVVVAWTKPTVLWKVPIRVGVVGSGGSSATTIVAVRGDEQQTILVLRETDSCVGWRTWPNIGELSETMANHAAGECFLMVGDRGDVAVVP